MEKPPNRVVFDSRLAVIQLILPVHTYRVIFLFVCFVRWAVGHVGFFSFIFLKWGFYNVQRSVVLSIILVNQQNSYENKCKTTAKQYRLI